MHPTAISSRRRSQSLDVQKRPAFFSLPRQPPLLTGRRSPAKYKEIERPPFDIPPPIRERLGAPHTKGIPTPQPVLSVLPHIAGWMEVADNVVGGHPHARPLITRIATQAEIALISGHVHIPWAYTPVKKIQPGGPVGIQKPTTSYATLSIIPSLALEDVGNTHGLPVWRAVNNKGKSLRHPRGKENIPIAPLSTCSRRG